MRLRFFHLRNYAPLTDIAINFSAESPLQRQCQIHFVVGVNGTGKTHLLQAMTETFIALARQKRPHFPVTLIYELGQGATQQTLIFDNPGRGIEVGWWQSPLRFPATYETSDWHELIEAVRADAPDWEPLIHYGTEWPGEGVGLPRTVLTYTTGTSAPWETLFRRHPPAVGVNRQSRSPDYDTTIERPPGWTRAKEIAYQTQLNTEESCQIAQELRKLEAEASGQQLDQEVCLLVTPTLLKFALLAVALPIAMHDLCTYETDEEINAFVTRITHEPDEQPGLRRLLAQVGWVWPLSVVFEIDWQPQNWTTAQKKKLLPFIAIATTAIREPAPSTKLRVFFDLKDEPRDNARKQSGETTPTSQARAFTYIGDGLLEALGGHASHPLDHFKLLLSLHREGLLQDIQIALQKTDTDNILLFDDLSDGEQMFLGRMALFHLMQGQADSLILLDEPETHFNDKWKREIVAIIDEVLSDTANAVMISTHSSIALTDVFHDEIVLFAKQEGQIKRIELASTTFGADPSEVMIRLFNVPDSVGQRAMKWLEQKLTEDYRTPEKRAELEQLIDKVGPGFYRSELRAILKRLEKNAASN